MLVVVSSSHEQGITEQPITRSTTQLCSLLDLFDTVWICSALFGTVRHCLRLFGTAALSLRRSARRHPIAIQ